MNFKTQQTLDTSRDIKKEAKAQLSGYWGQAVLMAVIPSLFSFFFIRNTADGSLWSWILGIIQSFIVVGVTFGFMNLLRNANYKLEALQEVFSPFRSEYFRNLLFLMVLKYVLIFLWSLLFLIPGIVKAYAYSQAELIYKDRVDRTGKQPTAKECLDESQRLMQGHKIDLFVLEFSFIGWILLSIVTFGLLNLWLTPYMTMSQVVFYENLTEGRYLQHSQPLEKTNNIKQASLKKEEEIGKNPDDFRDFDDF